MWKMLDNWWRSWRDEIVGLGNDLRQLAEAHLELARLESTRAARLVRTSAIIGGAGLVVLLMGLPLLLWVACDALATATETDRATWLLGVGGGCVLLGAIALLGVWRWLRRQWTGFDDTVAELREHAAYWRER